MYKVMCWDSVDPRLNIGGIATFSEAWDVIEDLKARFPRYTFQIFDDV